MAMAHKTNLKLLLILVFFAGLFLINQNNIVLAQSSYVLPYPSAMPGSIFYRVNLVKDELYKHWYFGDFGKFKYNLKMSDKYLVESKTLFEYKQYLLGYQALLRSDNYFSKIKPALKSSEKNGKNTSEKIGVLKEAVRKHVEELKKVRLIVPEKFQWVPEKDDSTNLILWQAIDHSLELRTSEAL